MFQNNKIFMLSFLTLFVKSVKDFIQKGGGVRPCETLATYRNFAERC